MHNLPPDSALGRRLVAAQNEDAAGWDLHAYLLADIFAAVTGEAHPARPNPAKKARRERAARLREQLNAQRERRQKQKEM